VYTPDEVMYGYLLYNDFDPEKSFQYFGKTFSQIVNEYGVNPDTLQGKDKDNRQDIYYEDTKCIIINLKNWGMTFDDYSIINLMPNDNCRIICQENKLIRFDLDTSFYMRDLQMFETGVFTNINDKESCCVAVRSARRNNDVNDVPIAKLYVWHKNIVY